MVRKRTHLVRRGRFANGLLAEPRTARSGCLDAGCSGGGAVDVAQLSSLDRDLLKDTLDVVKRFRLLLRQRFRLDALA